MRGVPHESERPRRNPLGLVSVFVIAILLIAECCGGLLPAGSSRRMICPEPCDHRLCESIDEFRGCPYRNQSLHNCELDEISGGDGELAVTRLLAQGVLDQFEALVLFAARANRFLHV